MDNVRSVTVKPNAKINIGLDIVSKLPNGYHELVTAMVPVDWCDTLEVTLLPRSGPDLLEIDGMSIDCDTQDNLVMKAVRALRQEADFGAVKLRLVKQIPFGAGLGGGSADAAFTLTAINSVAGLGLSDERLEGIASRLGADCAVFVSNQPKLCRGIGDLMSPIEIPALRNVNILIAKPSVGVSTAQAYAGVKPQTPAEPLERLLQLPLGQWQGRVKNDFEPTVVPRFAEIAQCLEAMERLGAAYRAMSGSGSAVFGIFPDDIPVPENALFPAGTVLRQVRPV